MNTQYIEHNGSRYAEPAEIKQISVKVNCSSSTAINAGGVPVISDGKSAYVLDHDCHSVIFGATGSKKTRNIIKPSLVLLAKHGESMIVNDPKGELYKMMKCLLDELGYKTHVLNFRDACTGSRWNPFTIVYKLYKNGEVDKSNMYIRDIAKCMYSQLASNCNDAFWTNSSEDYFTGLAQLIRDNAGEEVLTIENIRLTHNLGNEKVGTSRYINEFCSHIDFDSETVANLNGTIQAPNDTRESIRSVFANPLSLYSQDSLCDMLFKSDFEFSMIGKEKTAVFLITPDERTIYNPIISSFVKLSYGALIDTAEGAECKGVLPIRVNYMLDEFGNLPCIADFNSMITAGRSRNIRFNLCVQSLAQLYKTYSETIAENIIANCEAWYILRSNDDKLHDRLKKMCGTHISEHLRTEKALIDTMSIQRLKKERGEVLIKILGQYPFVTELPDIDDYDFNLPMPSEVNFTKRIAVKRVLFDIRLFVKELRAKKLAEKLPVSTEKTLTEIEDLEGIISKIDKKILELEASEAKERKERKANPDSLPKSKPLPKNRNVPPQERLTRKKKEE